MNEAIITRGLVKKYGRHAALNGFTLAVPSGSITGLVGRNGAGKTTWMMTVAGFVIPDAGEVSILASGPFDARRHGGRFTILPQDSDLPNEGRVRSLLIGYARLQGMTKKDAAKSADELIEVMNLTDKANASIRSLSHGMRKRVMVAQAFLGHPDVVMLDEPLSGLDPVEAERLRSFLLSLRGKTTLVVSSHQLDDIEKLCTHVAFVADGKVERMETLRAITSDSGRIVYALKTLPNDLAALEQECPGVRLSVGASFQDARGRVGDAPLPSAPLLSVGASFQDARGRVGDAPLPSAPLPSAPLPSAPLPSEKTLVAEFGEGLAVETVNAALLPRLVPFGVIAVTPGRSLEEAYLGK